MNPKSQPTLSQAIGPQAENPQQGQSSSSQCYSHSLKSISAPIAIPSTSSLSLSSHSLSIPQQQQLRCRICYDTLKPLVSICACTGSIEYVHQQCILDWIAKKLEISDVLDIPRCQICHERFHARMKIGKRKLCVGLLWEKVRGLGWKELGALVMHVLIFLICVYYLISNTISIPTVLFPNSFSSSPSTASPSSTTSPSIINILLTNFIIYLYGIGYFYTVMRSKQKWIEQSMVQVVEVVLQPKGYRRN